MTDVSLDAVPDRLCQLLGRAGEHAAVAEGVHLVEAIEAARAAAPRAEWERWDEAADKAMRTLAILRDYAEPAPEPEPEPERPPLVPLPRRMAPLSCQARRRPR